MTSLAAGIVDPTKAGKYPVVLSDALLGKDSKEVFTGIRYNHKPTLSSPTAPAQARIKQAPSSSLSKKNLASYDLSFKDDGGSYKYKGTRGVEDSQYVLIFDPVREVFVLHKVDSMFNMNLVQTPSADHDESLRQDYPQLVSHSISSSAKAAGPTSSGKKSTKATGEEKKTTKRKSAPKAKIEEKPTLAMPEKKPPPKPVTTSKPSKTIDEEDESSDDDLGLTIENPGGQAPRAQRDFSPNIFGLRRFSDLVQETEEGENDDADGEDDDDDNFEHFKLPSPINRQMQQTSAIQQPTQVNGDDEEEDEDEEMEDVGQQPTEADEPGLDDEMDLEAALLAELGEVDAAQESDVSEEE
ncbi:RNA polymerase II transcription elongation factor-domain-containing protein [Jackrogersella minutella]|nr:RNA polymerase II transcription elongation factor-domain-containing protein [Jackrogersella minutella]